MRRFIYDMVLLLLLIFGFSCAIYISFGVFAYFLGD